MKCTNKQIANAIVSEGKVVKRTLLGIVVEAFGHRYYIEYPHSKRPKITQLKENENDVDTKED